MPLDSIFQIQQHHHHQQPKNKRPNPNTSPGPNPNPTGDADIDVDRLDEDTKNQTKQNAKMKQKQKTKRSRSRGRQTEMERGKKKMPRKWVKSALKPSKNMSEIAGSVAKNFLRQWRNEQNDSKCILSPLAGSASLTLALAKAWQKAEGCEK